MNYLKLFEQIWNKVDHLETKIACRFEPSEKEQQQVLEQRAIKLAKEPTPSKLSEKITEFAIFKLENKDYAIETTFISEVSRYMPITPIPCTPGFVQGIINFRGTIQWVFDLRILLKLPNNKHGCPQMLHIQFENNHFTLLIDQIQNVLKVEETSISTLQTSTPMISKYIQREISSALVILDIKNLISHQNSIIYQGSKSS